LLRLNEANDGVPLISIITPVYNGSIYLEPLIQSIQDQCHRRIEHILINDGSTDDGATVAILAKYPHLKWWSRQNKGQYATLNEGIDAAIGDWLLIISADDMLAGSDSLSELLILARNAGEFDAIYGRTMMVNDNGVEISDRGRPDESSPKWLNYHFLVIHHCSLLVSRKFIISNKLYFDTSLKYTGDWDWIIRIIKLGRIGYFNHIVSKYRLHEQQTRQSVCHKKLIAEDEIVLLRHGSFLIIHKLIVLFFRLKKFMLIFSKDGFSSAVAALLHFFKKH